MAKTKTSDKIKLKNVRLSFPNLWTPKQFSPDQPARFEATFLLDPSDKNHAETIALIKKEIVALATDAYGGVPGDLKVCLTNNTNPDGSQKKAYDGYANHYFLATAQPAEMEPIPAGQPGYGINPKTGKPLERPKTAFLQNGKTFYLGQPGVVNRAVVPVREGEPEAPYGGAIVNATITLWAQNNSWGKRINANLVNVQFSRAAPAFGRGASAPEEDFDPIEQPEDEAGTPAANGVSEAEKALFG